MTILQYQKTIVIMALAIAILLYTSLQEESRTEGHISTCAELKHQNDSLINIDKCKDSLIAKYNDQVYRIQKINGIDTTKRTCYVWNR